MKITYQLLKKALVASFAIASTLASANTHTLTAWTETGQQSDILLAATQSTLLGPVVSNATASDINITTDLIIDSQSGAENLGSGVIKMEGGRLSVTGSGISISNNIELNNAGTSSQEWGGILFIEDAAMTGTISGTLNGHTNQLSGSTRASIIANTEAGDINSIEVDFSNNINKSTTSSTYSGVLINIGNVGKISRIRSISGNFINNSAQGAGGEVLSGAILNDDGGHMGLLAQSRSMEITGNYTQIGSGAKEYIGIYNDGITGYGNNIVTSIIQMNAYGEHKITVNDGISGRENQAAHQIININNNLDGFGDVIDTSTAPDYSTVEFNSLIEHQTINVENGILSLGSYTGSTHSTEASLENSILNITANGLVRTDADYLKTTSTVNNDGTLEFVGNGALALSIAGTGQIHIKQQDNGSASMLHVNAANNDFSGDVTLHENIQLFFNTEGENLGTGTFYMNGGKLFVDNGVEVANNIVLQAPSNTAQIAGGVFSITGASLTGTITGKMEGHLNQYSDTVHASVFSITGGSTVAVINADFINNRNVSTGKHALGGVIYNLGNTTQKSIIGRLTGDFIGNSAEARSDAALAGAIVNDDNASMGLLALTRSMEMTGNYTENDIDGKRYIAIFNDGERSGSGLTSTMNMNAYGEYSIVINDGISGRVGYAAYQVININNNLDGFGDDIDTSTAPNYSTVEFNSLIEHQTINVENGILSMGSYTDTDGSRSTEASLENSTLNITANGLVRTDADYLKTTSTVNNDGTLEFTGSGTLLLNISGSGELHVTTGATLYSNANLLQSSGTVNNEGTLNLTGGTLSSDMTNTGTVALAATVDVTIASTGSISGGTISQQYNSAAQNASLHVETGGSLSGITNYQLNFQNITSDSYTWENFLSWESAGAVMDYDSLSNMLSVSLGSVRLDSQYYTLTENDNSSYSLILNSNLATDGTWRYDAVTESNPAGLMSVVKNDYNSNTQSYTSTQQNIVFEGVFGDDMLTSEATGYEAMQSYKWDTLSDGTRILVALAEGETGADIIAYSSYNNGVGNPSSDVNSSQLGTTTTSSEILGSTHWSTWSFYVKLSTSTYISPINITGDMVGMNVYNMQNSGDHGSIGIIAQPNVTIDNITGDYIGNTYFLNNTYSGFTLGHATILMNMTATVNNITGDFISNTMRLEGNGGGNILSFSTLSFSGVMSNVGGNIGVVSSDFISNGFQFGWTMEHDDALLAGAIVQHEDNNFTASSSNAQITALHGNFIGNYTVDILNDTSEITNYVSAAGAINNSKSIIGNITGNFDGNYVVTHKSEDSAIAGAITNTAGTIAISTANDNVSFTGNYVNFVATDESVKTKYIAIQNRGTAERDAIIHISAYDENRVIFNDAITGASDQRENQIININNNTDGFGADIKSGVFEYSTVEFNNTVENQTINVENGTLKLGVFAGTSLQSSDGAELGLPASSAMLKNSVLNVASTATVNTDASYLGTDNSIANLGTIELTGGTLGNIIGGSGSIEVSGTVSSNANYFGGTNSISNTGIIELTGGTLSNVMTSTGTVTLGATADVTIASTGSIVGGTISQQYNSAAQNASLHVEAGGSLSGITNYQLNFQNISSDSYTWENFLSWESAGAVMDYDSLSNMLSVSLGSVRLDSQYYTLTENDNSSYSLILNSNLATDGTWRYDAVTESNPAGLMSVVKNDYNSNTQSYTSTQQNIVFEGVFGDDMLTSEATGYEAMQSYKWDTLSDGTRILVALAEGETGADIIAYSSYNNGVGNPSSDVNSSQLGTTTTSSEILGSTHWSTWSFYVKLSTSTYISPINITGDMVGMNVYNMQNSGDHGSIGIIAQPNVTIDNITGDYIGNTYFLNNTYSGFTLGHATILMNMTATVNNITGDFISNTMRLEGNGGGNILSFSTLSFSGVMSNVGGNIGVVSSDFISNGFQFGWTMEHDDALLAGAIVQHEDNNFTASSSNAQITALHGNFIGNYTVDILNDTSEITNYVSAAGAINNSKSIIGNITGNFDGNYVVTHKSEDSAIAGAITNTAGTIAISTANDNVSFTGNYVNFVATDESVKTKYIAIQNRGTAERDAIIHISAYDENRVIFNDAITGASDQRENQIININNNTDGFGADIKSGVFEYSTVEFNNTVENQTINVHAGTLKLGAFAGTNLSVAGKDYSLPAQESKLVASTLTAKGSSTVIVEKADSLGNDNTIALTEQSRMEVGAGVLSSHITVADAATLHIAANVTINSILTVESSASITGNSHQARLLESVTLGINAGIYGINISLSNSRIEASESAAAPASNARADVIDIYNVNTKANIDSISGSLALHIAIIDEAAFLDNYYKDIPLGVLLTDLDGLTMSDFGTNYDFYSNIHITFGSISATVTGVENSGSGVLFAVTIPEPSTATLSLLALAGLLARRRRKKVSKLSL